MSYGASLDCGVVICSMRSELTVKLVGAAFGTSCPISLKEMLLELLSGFSTS